MTKRSFFLVASLLALLTLTCVAQDAARQNTTPPDPYKPTLDRLESLTHLWVGDWKINNDVAHPEDPALDDSAWQSVSVKNLSRREQKEQPHWKGARVFRQWITLPDKINGYSVQGGRARLDIEFGSDGDAMITAFSNGSLINRGDENMQEPLLLTENAQPGQKFLVAIRVNAGDVDTVVYHSELLIDAPRNRPDPGFLRMEILSSEPMIVAYEDGKAEREQQLSAAVKAIDFSPLDKGDQAAFDASLRASQAKLQSLSPWLKQFKISAVGNSHIDMAWLWPWTETVEVVRNTFQSVLDLMSEYPDFKFTMSSARTYEWMQEKYPDLFQQIQQRSKEGRWEVIGGMWVEPDLNMPDGESLVRQILVGKEYFQKNFGADIKIGWNPDSFGYNWQLPQIYKKSGMDYFVTSKLLWATDYTKFPYRLFWWQAPDGTRLLTYFPHEYANDFNPPQMTKDLAQYAPLIFGPKVNDNPGMLYLFGIGDHGGGPTRTMLDQAHQLREPSTVFPTVEYTTAKDFFANLETELPSLKVPTWNDELYFEYHRGVLTTQAETKRRIRRDEETMLNAEKYSSLALLFGKPYPQDEFTLQWKNLLFDHFHDIMPGSGIAVNYLDARRNLEEVQRAGDQIIHGALKEIAAHANTEGDGVPVIVFNSLSWPRTEVIDREVQLPGPAKQVEVRDAAGKPVESQLLSMDSSTNRARLLIMTKLPSLGYQTYFVRATTKSPTYLEPVRATADSLENEYVRLKIDPKTGCMTSLFDKRSQTEALAPAETDTGGPKDSICGNLLQTFYDKPKAWDAWNVDADFENKHWDLTQADEVKLVESGPLRAVIEIKNHFQNSTFVRDITMYAGVPRVDVRMQADWHEKHILLKVAFPVSVHNDKATFEIPYGSIERPTTRNTPAEQAKFEVPAQRWADLSDAKHGFSLLNDCKYGYDAKGNVLRLSLLRSPEWPDPHADEGYHEFTYSLYPHGGGWRDAMTIRQGYELNYPATAMETFAHVGALGAEHSFLRVSGDNVVVTAIKKSDTDNSLVVRFYEWAGKGSDVQLQLASGATSANETDLMEKPIGDLSLRSDAVTVHTKPYEIKTVKLQYAFTPPQEPKLIAK